jgi:hypothetical protein
MQTYKRDNRWARTRLRAAVAVQVAVFSGVMIGFGALAIDLGQLYTARGELQRAVDSAALAGVSSYFTDAGLMGDQEALTTLAQSRAGGVALHNPTLGASTQLETPDLVLGTLDAGNPHALLDPSGAARLNAVQVLLRRTAGSANGPVDYLFARIFGLNHGDVVAAATAVVDDRFAGYRETETNRLLLPFTIHRDYYEQMLASGGDEWSFGGELTSHVADGVPEIKLYPWKLSGVKGKLPDGAGNFGALDIGSDTSGLPPIEWQIIHGITPEQLESAIGTATVVFFDESGNPVSYEIGGTPGLKAGMEDALRQREGELIGFFLHDSYWDSGSGCVYHIIDIRFGRVMHTDLAGSPKTKGLLIQPVAYTGPGVIISEYAPSCQGAAGYARLVR